MAKNIKIEEFIGIIKSLLGEGTNNLSGQRLFYRKGDVMKYKDNLNNYYFYKCKNEGYYSIPDTTNFIKIGARQ